MVSRGYGRAVVPSHSQLFIDGEPQRLTRYPKEDEFLTIAGVVDADVNEWGEEAGKLEAGFYYDDEEPKTWSASEDIWVHGYWSWDWANSYEARCGAGHCKLQDCQCGSLRQLRLQKGTAVLFSEYYRRIDGARGILH
ncbi:MAG: hypothetical protein ACLR23_09135 [Clostridia bacterium]